MEYTKKSWKYSCFFKKIMKNPQVMPYGHFKSCTILVDFVNAFGKILLDKILTRRGSRDQSFSSVTLLYKQLSEGFPLHYLEAIETVSL